MRTLNRNKQTLNYALYDHREELRDSFNNLTGEFRVVYSTPVSLEANISPNAGRTIYNVFGVELKYNRTMVVDDIHCPITETSLIWFGVPTTQEANYRVVSISKSLNSVIYYLEEIYKTSQPVVEEIEEEDTEPLEMPPLVEQEVVEESQDQVNNIPNLLDENYN